MYFGLQLSLVSKVIFVSVFHIPLCDQPFAKHLGEFINKDLVYSPLLTTNRIKKKLNSLFSAKNKLLSCSNQNFTWSLIPGNRYRLEEKLENQDSPGYWDFTCLFIILNMASPQFTHC